MVANTVNSMLSIHTNDSDSMIALVPVRYGTVKYGTIPRKYGTGTVIYRPERRTFFYVRLSTW
jgi:hypothetical protein